MVFPVIEWIYIYQAALNVKTSEHLLGDIFFLSYLLSFKSSPRRAMSSSAPSISAVC